MGALQPGPILLVGRVADALAPSATTKTGTVVTTNTVILRSKVGFDPDTAITARQDIRDNMRAR